MSKTLGTLVAVACGVLVTVAACGSPAQSAQGGGPGAGATTPDSASGAPPSAVVTPTVTSAPPPGTTTAGTPATTAVPGQPPAGGAGTGKANSGGTPVPAARLETAHVLPPPQGVRTQGRQVMFNASQIGCQHVTAQVAGQSASAVTIDVVATVTSRPGQACPRTAREIPLAVTLAAPLGSRTVVFHHLTRHS